MKIYHCFPFLLLANINLLAQNIWHVNYAASASNPTGASWNQAFNNLNEALNAALPGDEIWVAQGTYKPTNGTDRMAHFTMASDVGLYGGFAGNETFRSERNWNVNKTILSGDIGVAGDSSDNSYTVLYAFRTLAYTIIDGFIIEEGNANSPDNSISGHFPPFSGGGIYLDGYDNNQSELHISNCTFRKNRARYLGGAVYANGKKGGIALISIKNCVFEENLSNTYGGAVAIENTSIFEVDPLEISDCLFYKNISQTEGGAVWLKHHQAIKIEHCIFDKNTTQSGNVFIGGPSSIYPVLFSNCSFTENETTFGGYGSCIEFDADVTPVASGRKIKIRNSKFWKSNNLVVYINGAFNETIDVSFEQCIFWENAKELYSWFNLSALSSTNFVNCLFYNNLGYKLRPGASYLARLKLTNCILIDHVDGPNAAVVSPWLNYQNLFFKNCLVSHSNCGALFAGFNTNTCENINFGVDPLFLNPSAGVNADFHLSPCSQAINTGFMAVLDSFNIDSDFDGNPRVRNELVDIGPFETNLFLEATITAPSCVGKNDGKAQLNGNFCTPYTYFWKKDSETGFSLNALSAGTYYLTVTDLYGLTIQDTLVVPAPDTLVLEAFVQQISCPGGTDGMVILSPHGGTPFLSDPTYHLSANNPATLNLGSGFYAYSVTDANGCTATTIVSIESPPDFAFFYTVQNASSPFAADGAILFDSISGGWNGAPTPGNLFNLSAGNYSVTVSDNLGCLAIQNIEVGFTSSVQELSARFNCQVFPNPGFSNVPISFKSDEDESFTLKVFDVLGKCIYVQFFQKGGGQFSLNTAKSAVYYLEIQGESGRRLMLRYILLQAVE